MGGLEHADPEAFLEPDAVIADRRREHDVREPLDAPPRAIASSDRPSLPARIMSTCSRVMTAPNPMRAPVAPSRNDSRMKLSLPVRSVIFGQLLEQPGGVDEPAHRTTPP